MSEQRQNYPSIVQLAGKNGPLAQIWLASTLTNLNRSYLKTNILQSVEEISKVTSGDYESDALEPVTLRVSGELLHGVVRVYSQKANYLLSDISDLLQKINSLFRGNIQRGSTVNIDTVLRIDQLILQDTVTEMDVLAVPALELDDNETHPNLLERGHSMDRQVQGANAMGKTAPWDLSLEVGRRFAPDDDLGQQSSILDLNFELSGDNSKSWGEGTHNSEFNNENSGTPQSDHNETVGNLPDDLPDDNMDWDLGVVQQDHEDSESGSEHDSIEVGRKMSNNSILHETAEFGFDLEVSKDPFQDAIEEQEEALSAHGPVKATPKRSKNTNLINVKRIHVDSEYELKDSVVKGGPSAEIISDDTLERSIEPNKKRKWSELASAIDFLPNYSVNHFSPLSVYFKKAKHFETPNADHEEEFVLDDHIDMSLGLDETLFDNSSIHAGTEEEIPPADQSGIEGHPSIPSSAATEQPDMHEFSHISESEITQIKPTQEVRLDTGELVSKSTVEMANAVRTTFINKQQATFDELLKTRYSSNLTDLTKSEVSKAFFELLVLATAECIDISQQQTFGEITVNSNGQLYEKFIEA
ncbi:HEL006Wp [Eremothecium sinecaudum]|uniref:HEL006Wp n=1 Tax=Eremothecium sinecaudum TaxID=45286 RepID=A0A0X8HTQ3_9SACH|nr:HEL006Wp [Eremothecium sinecaudum]AMD21274.1 HEL006Wp [Eremothecium sinecaudum]